MKRLFIILLGTLSLLTWLSCGGSGGGTPPPPPVDTTPAITGLIPAAINTYSPGFQLTVNGSKFQNGAVIIWDGKDQLTQWFNSGAMTTNIPSTETYNARNVNIQVRGPDGKTSNVMTFSVTAPASNPGANIFSISPSIAQAADPGFTLNVSGSGFIGTSKITVNGVERQTTFIDIQHLSTQIPASDIAQPGTLKVAVSNPAPGGGSLNSLDLAVYPGIKKAALTARSLIYDSSRQKIYASVSSGAPANANTITVIDPVTAAVGASVSVGTDPNQMFLSDDGKYLYVILETDRAIRRVDLTTMTADLKFQLTGFGGINMPTSVSVMPGASGTVAVVSGGQVFIADNGVARPNLSDWNIQMTTVQFGATPGVLYGVNSAGDFYTMTVDANGVTVGSHVTGRFNGSRMSFNSGLLFSNFGTVFNPTTKSRVGMFPRPTFQNCFTTDPANGKAYGIAFQDNGHSSGFTAYDSNQFTPISTVNIPSLSFDGCYLITLGSNGFAFARNNEVDITNVTFPAAEPLANFDIKRVAANHLLYDKGRNRIYASVKGSVPTIGNSIVTIDPGTGAVQSSTWVGSEPDVMTLADDGKTLYVGLDQSDAVRKVDVSTGTAAELIQLYRSDSDGRITVNDLSTVPGTPASFAVSRTISDAFSTRSDVSVFDGSVSRQNAVPADFYFSPLLVRFASPTSLVAVASNPGVLYTRMSLDANGLSVSAKSVFDNNAVGVAKSVEYSAGRLYTSSGAVIDTSADSVVGYARGLINLHGFFLDASSNKMYFLEYGSAAGDIALIYDTTTLAPLNYLAPQNLATDVFDHDLVVLNGSNYAFAATDKVILTSAALTPLPTMTIKSSVLPPTASGKNYRFTLSAVSNVGTPSWTLGSTSGPLPPGLLLGSDGSITGTVGSVASTTSYPFHAIALTATAPPSIASKDFSILVQNGALGSNDTCATATAVSYGTLRASISPYGDIDVYSFDGTQGDKVSIVAFPSQGPFGQNLQGLDPVIELLDSNCTRLAMNDDASPSDISAAINSFTLPSNGKYYIRVLDARGDGRPDFIYDLRINPF